MLKLKFQYFGPWMQRADLLKKTLMLEKIEDKSRRRWQRMRWLHSITDSMNVNLSKLQETVKYGEPGMLQCMGSQSGTQLSNWTTATNACCGQLNIVNHSFLLPGGGFNICKTAQRYCFMYLLMGNEDLAPSRQCCFSTVCFSFVSHLLLSLINNCLYLPPWNSGKVMDTERLCAQESHRALLGITVGETRCQYVIALQYLIRICVTDSDTRI